MAHDIPAYVAGGGLHVRIGVHPCAGPGPRRGRLHGRNLRVMGYAVGIALLTVDQVNAPLVLLHIQGTGA